MWFIHFMSTIKIPLHNCNFHIQWENVLGFSETTVSGAFIKLNECDKKKQKIKIKKEKCCKSNNNVKYECKNEWENEVWYAEVVCALQLNSHNSEIKWNEIRCALVSKFHCNNDHIIIHVF